MIADYFGIKKSDLIEEMFEDEDDLLNDDTVIVDVFSKIFFGNITSDKTNAFKVGEELIPPEWIKNKQSYFGLIMPDNTMDPEFHQNDCIILREQNKMTKFQDPNESRKEMSYYTYDEFKKFISYEEDLRWKCVFEILYYCGLRKGELKGLLGKIFVLIKKYYLLINK